jgi:predicted nucleic acid-binding protein
MVVVDASVALKWFLDEPDSLAATVVGLRQDLVAPDLLIAEVANALWRAVRIGRLLPDDGRSAAARLPRELARLVACATLISRALDIAQILDHPAYDCFYLALAEREAAPLVTADRRLRERVAGTQWEGLVHDLQTFQAET